MGWPKSKVIPIAEILEVEVGALQELHKEEVEDLKATSLQELVTIAANSDTFLANVRTQDLLKEAGLVRSHHNLLELVGDPTEI